MTTVCRLNLMVLLVFFIAMLGTVYFMLTQASRDIAREVATSVNSVQLLLNTPTPAVIETLISSPMRHVHVAVVKTASLPVKNNDWPWLLDYVTPSNTPDLHIRRQPLVGDSELLIIPDPADEWEEVLESIYFVLALFVLTAALSSTAISIAVQRGLKPITEILDALNAISLGELQARLGRYSVTEINTISDKFNTMADELQNKEKENTALTHALLTLKEQERSMLARELHDDLGQYLTGIRSQAYVLSKTCDASNAQIAGQLMENCRDMQTGFRRLIHQLHPLMLEEVGLDESLKLLAQKWSASQRVIVNIELSEHSPALSLDVQTHIYRIVQEALNNIARHAKAKHVTITRRWADNSNYLLTISDNGLGFQGETKHGIGLRSMKERARLIGGQLIVDSTQSGVTLALKLKHRNPS